MQRIILQMIDTSYAGACAQDTCIVLHPWLLLLLSPQHCVSLVAGCVPQVVSALVTVSAAVLVKCCVAAAAAPASAPITSAAPPAPNPVEAHAAAQGTASTTYVRPQEPSSVVCRIVSLVLYAVVVHAAAVGRCVGQMGSVVCQGSGGVEVTGEEGFGILAAGIQVSLVGIGCSWLHE